MTKLHPLPHPVRKPKRFTFPFCYEPHPACLLAAEEVKNYVQSVEEWHDELQQGKMFGVLVVEDKEGRIGYLAAFSGQLANSNNHPFFVPAVYDILQPDGYFKTEEARISEVNQQVKTLENASDRLSAIASLEKAKAEATLAIDCYKTEMAEAKRRRDEIRAASNSFTCQVDKLTSRQVDELNERVDELTSRRVDKLSEEVDKLTSRQVDKLSEEVDKLSDAEANNSSARQLVNSSTDLEKQSQFMKAELRRMKKRFAADIEEKQMAVDAFNSKIELLKQQRKQMSDALQQWIFRQYEMLNAKGDKKNLIDVFSTTTTGIPPAGAGDCCAPKLLQYAYRNNMRPICMGEFWGGRSPVGEIRRHGHFYPSCSSKCKPILGFMLQGLDVDPDPMLRNWQGEIETLYEDEWLAVVCKPAGLLTTPGRNNMPSLWSIMSERWPEATGPICVHRLDMATSGLLVLAKTKDIHQRLQEQFESRTVKKRYIALLEGIPKEKEGEINLPLVADLNDRPRQKVDYEHGKPAHTLYNVIEVKNGKTLVHLSPVTGRTHQLRVHCAHPSGLNIPIVGDELYGTRSNRLCLHAEYIEFEHPVTGKRMEFEREAEFSV